MNTNYKQYGNSAFWLDMDDDDILQSEMTETQKRSNDLYKLASYRRAIGNFVSIVSGSNIPVRFAEKGDSYTDGQSVTISSKLDKPKEFDVAVGLALHEGSHLKLSDFEILKSLSSRVPEHVKDAAVKRGVLNPFSVIKALLNVIEDRRIDYHIYSTSPGYRDYYHAMYDKYFNAKIIDKALLSSAHRDETIDSYLFRIINLHNKNTDLDALNGLREISEIIDIPRIGRLTDSTDAFKVALDVFKVILKNVNMSDADDDGDESSDGQSGQGDGDESGDGQSGQGDGDEGGGDQSGGDEEGDGQSGGDEEGDGQSGGDGDEEGDGQSGGDEDADDQDSTEGQGGSTDGDGDEGDATDNSSTASSSDVDGKNSKSKSDGDGDLTDKELDRLTKKIKKQKDFLNGDVTKRKISTKDAKTLETIEASGSELKTVGADLGDGTSPRGGVECVVVKRLTNQLFESNMFPYTHRFGWGNDKGVSRPYEKQIARGIKIGTILGKKLKIRSEDRSTVFNRQRNGKIDKRMISKLGFGDESVFQYTEIDKYKKANIHISIDASYSMNGRRWEQTLTNTVALCKAIDMIPNLDIQVSIRSTEKNGEKPYIVLAYDSRVDKFSKVRKMFPAFDVNGYTPEGLTFEAIVKEFVPSGPDMDSYFLNLSDGEPYIPMGARYGFYGSSAIEHTKKIVDKIRTNGITVLSYFIQDYAGEASPEFKRMYGRSAKAIDVTNINQIVKTVNAMFMEKKN